MSLLIEITNFWVHVCVKLTHGFLNKLQVSMKIHKFVTGIFNIPRNNIGFLITLKVWKICKFGKISPDSLTACTAFIFFKLATLGFSSDVHQPKMIKQQVHLQFSTCTGNLKFSKLFCDQQKFLKAVVCVAIGLQCQ